MNCNYCGAKVELQKGSTVYPRREDLADVNVWVCPECHARCGCHKGTELPMGTLANAELRELRMHTHTHLDRLWKEHYMSRNATYTWLAFELDVPFKFCHIAMFDLDKYRKIIGLAKKKLKQIIMERNYE